MIKKNPLLFAFIIVLVIILGTFIKTQWILIYKPFCKTSFVRVYNTGVVSYYSDKGYQYDAPQKNTIKRYDESYVIINAPTDVNKLKEEVDNFEKSTPYINNNKDYDEYSRHYIKESNQFSRNWRPNWFLEDEGAVNDHIVVRKTDNKIDNTVSYLITPRDANFNEIERQTLVEDKIIVTHNKE